MTAPARPPRPACSLAIGLVVWAAGAAVAGAAEATPNALDYSGPAWSPYLVGALIGVLSWLTFLVSNESLGASSQYANVAGVLGKAVAPNHTEKLPYYRDNPPGMGWGMMLAVGMVVGAGLGAWSGGEFTGRWLPPMWADHFGAGSHVLRGSVAFAGGALMAFGARLAGGCTSGHGISGTLQLSVGSWIAAAGFFAGGIATASLLFRT